MGLSFSLTKAIQKTWWGISAKVDVCTEDPKIWWVGPRDSRPCSWCTHCYRRGSERYKLQRKICRRIRVHLQAILSKRNRVMKPVKIALKVKEKMRMLQSCKRMSGGTEMYGPLRRAASTHSASGSSWETYWVLLKQLKWSWMCVFFLSAVIQIAMWANLRLKNREFCYEDIDFQNERHGDTDQRCPKRNQQASGVS